jgi:hypothetical protein
MKFNSKYHRKAIAIGYSINPARLKSASGFGA